MFFSAFSQFCVLFSSASSKMVVFGIVFWLLNCTLEWSQLLRCEACPFLLRDRLLADSFLVHFPAPGQAIFKVIIISEPFLKWHKRKQAHTHTWKSSLHGGITDFDRNGISCWLPCSVCQTSHYLDVINCKVATAEEGRGGHTKEGLLGKPAALAACISEVLCLGAFAVLAFHLQRMAGKHSCVQLQCFTGCRLKRDKI